MMQTLRYVLLSAVFVLAGVWAFSNLHASARPSVPPAELRGAPQTLQDSVKAGDIYITELPAPASTQDTAYQIVQAPAMSWLVGRSFFWETRPEDAGSHRITFQTQTTAAPDTLVLLLTVTP